MRTLIGVLAALLGAAAALVMTPSDAHACGGCFGPPPSPTGTTTVVAHKMAVAIGDRQTTLWDQIEYSGAPEDFAWVLPVASTVEVELGSQTFFDALDAQTRIVLTAPPPPSRSCGSPCPYYGYGGGADAGRATDAAPYDGGVTVYHAAVVGPYETATIGSSDPNALVQWLLDHGYAVPDAMLPTIQYYVDQGSSFAALRLRPDASVTQMQPVRVTTPGLGLTFPLRMVAAGATDRVGLELYVFAEGRMETANFPAESVYLSDLVYDFATGRFNYDDQFQLAIDRGGGRGWVTEYASEITSLPYATTTSPDGGTESPDADLAIVRASFSTPRMPYLTRLRTSLEPRFLDQDLVLTASSGGNVSSQIYVAHELHVPVPAPCPPPVICAPPPARDAGADGSHTGSGRGAGCSTVPSSRGAAAPLCIAGVLAGLVASRRQRRA